MNLKKMYRIDITRVKDGKKTTSNLYYPNIKTASNARRALISMFSCRFMSSTNSDRKAWNSYLKKNPDLWTIEYESFDYKKGEGFKTIKTTIVPGSVSEIIEPNK